MDTGHGGTYDPVMPVCARCGEDNPARASFCLACAAPLTAPAAARREERKRVSVLFCDLVGFTSRAERLDVEDVRGLLGPYYQRLRAELERYGGTVEKVIGDAVMALFGAPTAHEDDRSGRCGPPWPSGTRSPSSTRPTRRWGCRCGSG
jgi:class 3 adenylate cyclase